MSKLYRVFLNKFYLLAADRKIAHNLCAWRSVIGEETIAIAREGTVKSGSS